MLERYRFPWSNTIQANLEIVRTPETASSLLKTGGIWAIFCSGNGQPETSRELGHVKVQKFEMCME